MESPSAPSRLRWQRGSQGTLRQRVFHGTTNKVPSIDMAGMTVAVIPGIG
jgi:hypothetical protein